MPPSRLLKRIDETLEVPRDLALGRYPSFVTGGSLPQGDVPVFVFHSVEPESFGRKLRHLAENGYVTLSADEYRRGLRGEVPFPDKAVLLTFDDGRGSLWSVGAPLLRRHGMRGVVFLVPGRMFSRPPAPTLEDVEADRATRAALLGREDGDGSLLSWEEVEALSREGVFDFQSHTLTHARVHVSPRIAGFVTPSSRLGYAAFDVPIVEQDGRDLLAEELPLGTPLLESAPRCGEDLRFFEEPDFRAAFIEAVANGGGEAFFNRPGWETRLRDLAERTRVRGRLELPKERASAIRHELLEARLRIPEHTGKPVTDLCYPWHVCGPTARSLALEVGYEAAFWGKVPGTVVTRTGGDLMSIARLGEDYVERLPGKGQESLLAVLRRKWSRRLHGRS